MKWKEVQMSNAMFSLRNLLIVFFLWLALMPVQGNNAFNFRFEYIQMEDGLPQNSINTILKDSDGFMWFGTSNGLCRYDGYTFKVFKVENEENEAVPHNLIRALAESHDRKVWIGTAAGICYFDLETEKMHRVEADNGLIIKANTLVFFDGKIWVGTSDHGIFTAEFSSEGELKIENPFNESTLGTRLNSVNHLYLTSDNQLIAGTRYGLYAFNSASKRMEPWTRTVGISQETLVNWIHETVSGDLYLGTFYGLYVLKRSSVVPLHLLPSPNQNFTLEHATVKSIAEDAAGNVLIGTLGGLQVFNPTTNRFQSFPKTGPDHFKLNNQFVNTIFCDRAGNVWVGTDKGGVNKFNIYQKVFSFFTNDPKNSNSLNENTINSIFREGQKLWIGTAGGGLNLVDLQTQRFEHYRFNANNGASLSSNYVTSILRGSDGGLWVSTWGGGLNRIQDQAGMRIDRIFPNDSRFKNSLVNAFVSTLVEDPRGFLVVGTEGGLSLFDYRNKRFTSLLAPVKFSVPITEVGCVLLDSKGFYWIGTRNGLFRFPAQSCMPSDKASLEIDQLQFFDAVRNGGVLPGNYVTSLLEDSKGTIWVGTYGYGLAKCVVNKIGELECESYTQQHGLSNNAIYGLLEDKYRNIWISTDFGLSRLNPETKTFKNFFKQDGLLNNQFYWSAAHKAPDGTLYFGGTEGLNYFQPENLTSYAHIATPKISKLRVHNIEIKPSQKLHKRLIIREPIYNADTISLSYKDNNISFDFTAFDYYLPDKIQYSYMLEGVDKEWVVVPAQRRFATYNNLKGGEYTFLLKATNSDGVWNELPTKLTIFIRPPFWETLWFLIAIVVLVLSGTFLLIQYQVTRFIEQKKNLEEKVKQRTQQIEKQKVMLEEQAVELQDSNHILESRQVQIEQQKAQLEVKNNEIIAQNDELMLLNNRIKDINLQQMRFFTNISHEFRTPLTLIVSPLEKLIENKNLDSDTTGIIKTVNRSAQRLLQLINQLLEIRKIETGNQRLTVEKTDCKLFFSEVFDAFSEVAKKNSISYQLHLYPACSDVWIDREKVENILYNLLSNAFKFTPAEGNIELHIGLIERGVERRLHVRVVDSGLGISSDHIHKLFDRFYQVTEAKNRNQSGTGIGLSLVKDLIDLMHGTIDVESNEGVGTQFSIEIPASMNAYADDELKVGSSDYESELRNKVALLSEQLRLPSDSEMPKTAKQEPIKVLIVEDHDELRNFLANNLSDKYLVYTAENGKEGFDIANSEDISLVVSDIMMPQMNGLELCRKLKNTLYTSHIPVVLLTAKGLVEDQIEGLESGADDYIAKPFNMNVLAAKIQTLIENRRKLRSLYFASADVTSQEITTNSLDDQFFVKVNEVVEKFHTDSAFDVDRFASEMCVSRSQLYKKMKAITDLSANDFINVYRLKKSLELLKHGQLQISEIAYQVGFNDPKYFSRIFKKFYKKSPSEFLPQKRVNTEMADQD
jgi:signal transduction histidine kinase/ligand-binding sensor domain-containing protein/DNA-binding response OmpR family regulator